MYLCSQDRVLSNKNVTVHFNTGIEDAYGGETLSGLMLTDRTTGESHGRAFVRACVRVFPG